MNFCDIICNELTSLFAILLDILNYMTDTTNVSDGNEVRVNSFVRIECAIYVELIEGALRFFDLIEILGED